MAYSETTMRHLAEIICIGLIVASIGVLIIVYPQKTYELFVFHMGKDNHRRWSPEHGQVYRRLHQFQGAIMFAVAIALLVLTIFGLTK